MVESPLSASHSQSVGIGSSSGIGQHCHHITHSCARVSGPVDICCRPTGGDTGEGELRAGSIEVRVWRKRHAGWNGDVSYSVMITVVNELKAVKDAKYGQYKSCELPCSAFFFFMHNTLFYVSIYMYT